MPASTGTGTSTVHRLAVWAFGLGAFSVQFDSFALNLALPSIGADLHMPTDRLPLAVAAYLLACGAAMVPGGRAGDALGHRRPPSSPSAPCRAWAAAW
ncbi:MFS transporter [Nocardiopsis baichengensis]|uniref:MFS transporter n=1 Tax=Nocardiopsis baichengensis TaxID=280240 RepID=UPI00034D9DFD|nr:MFS transporter [Nocardiopsis baichengensis]